MDFVDGTDLMKISKLASEFNRADQSMKVIWNSLSKERSLDVTVSSEISGSTHYWYACLAMRMHIYRWALFMLTARSPRGSKPNY